MKVMIVTVPLRKKPCAVPPFGALSVINYLRKHGGDDVSVEFFNIDAHRPEFSDVVERIRASQPDVIGISAVVSTAYRFTKALTEAIKPLLPSVKVVVGGNLCASADVLLRKAHVDYCVVGEGEKVFLNLVRHLQSARPHAELRRIPGLVFLDEEGTLVNTGYEAPLPAEEIWDIDWDDIVRDGTVDIYFPPIAFEELVGRTIRPDDERFNASSMAGKREGYLTCAKGCVSRCTFCHRWDKGMRHIPLDIVFARLDEMIRRFDVGLVHTATESFGADKRWADEFIRRIASYGVMWIAGGVRTSTASPEFIERAKQAGCYSIIYGNETGSEVMLQVMEKKVDIQDNYNAARWTVEAGLGNIVQLVIGMPGESPETIEETIGYCKYVYTLSPHQDPRQISINYAQALPGTPLYEFARAKNLIGRDLDAEEEYLIAISDKDAADPLTFINFTNYSRITVLNWNLLIRIAVRCHYFRTFGSKHYYDLLLNGSAMTKLPDVAARMIEAGQEPSVGLFLKLAAKGQASALLACYPEFFYRVRKFSWLLTMLNTAREYGVRTALNLVADFFLHLLKKVPKPWQHKYRSLRKIMNEEIKGLPGDDPTMGPLRKGR